jgi:hypothetical protein
MGVDRPVYEVPVDVQLRFWARVQRGEPQDCWPFEGAKDQDGYGQFMIDRRNHRAHRVALLIDGRPVPAGMVTRHTCGVRECVNPAHLIAGTQAENIQDAVDAGTFNPPRLPRAVVDRVLELYEPRVVGYAAVASIVGISKTQVARIVKAA